LCRYRHRRHLHSFPTRRSSDLRTFELRVSEFIAAIAVNLGDFNAADLRTERAKALAEDIADPRAVASLYENLTVTRQRQGDLERSEEHTSELQSPYDLVCRLLL